MTQAGPDRPRTARAAFGFAVALTAIMLGLLIGPMPTQERAAALCLYPIKLPGPARLLLNCDANEFMETAADPATILQPGAIRQMRPVFILSGYLGSFVAAPVAWLLQPLMPTDPGHAAKNVAKARAGLKTLLPIYLSYVGLNVVLLLTAFMFYADAVRRFVPVDTGEAGWLIALCGVLLAGNDVVKAFVWSPHTQMFNILIPVLGCWLLARPVDRSRVSLALWSLGIAGGILAYAAWVIVLPCLLGSTFLARHASRTPGRVANASIDAALVVTVTAAPVLAWSLVLHRIVGAISMNEVSRYREFVWIADAWGRGPQGLFASIGAKLGFFVRNAVAQAIPAMLIMVLAWVALRWGGAEARRGRGLVPAASTTLSVSLLCLAFFVVVGWPAARLAYPVVPPLIVLAAVAAATSMRRVDPQRQQALLFGVGLIVVGWSLFSVLKAGPLS